MTTPPTKSTPPPSAEQHPAVESLKSLVNLPPAVTEHAATPRVLMLMIGLIWGWLLTGGNDFNPSDFVTGEIAHKTVRSSSQLVIEDPEATQQAREAAVKAILPIVNHLESLPFSLQNRVSEAFAALRKQEEVTEDLRSRVDQHLGFPIAENHFDKMVEIRNDLKFEQILRDAVGLVGQTRIAAEPQKWAAAYPDGVDIHGSSDADKEPLTLLPDSFRTVLSVDEARNLIEEQIFNRYDDMPYQQRKLLSALLEQLVQPNLLPNPVATEKAQQDARDSIKPVYFQIKAGEVIVRSGERITAVQVKQLRGLHREQSHFQEYLESTAKTVVLILAVFILMPYVHHPGWRNLGHPQDLFFTLVISSAILLIIQTGRNLAEPFVLAVPNLPRESILLLLPFATVGMIFRLFFRPKIAFRIAVLFALAMALFVEPTGLILPYCLLGSVTGVQVLQHSKRRSQFLQAGASVGLVQSAIWLAYAAMDSSIPSEEVLRALPLAFLGGLIASVLTSTLMPLCEWIGRYVSEVRLLELAQDDQPLLKWLHLNAPGTFNHVISVARLAETAAERIGADDLLTRVGAYYHDIGKGYWPSYFVENQRSQNPHDKLKPQLSSRVIIAHVTHGAELARRNNLPPIITDFILEHHGTSRVEYFYRQAQEQEGDIDGTTDDTVFRYPGPKPRSKETALVMLADVVESATRTLDNPTPDRIAAFVSRLIEKIYADNQLDQAPLTLKDLSTAKVAFTDVLTGMYHHRIDYPLGLKPGEKTGDVATAI